MPLGGFSGTVRTPTLGRVRDLVRAGRLRFFWFGWFGGPGSALRMHASWLERAGPPAPKG
jgi:hypothetical protein